MNVEGTNNRKKMGKSCIFCRRSHLLCNGVYPCERCIRRNIAHLCINQDNAGTNITTPNVPLPPPQPSSTSIKPSNSENNIESLLQQPQMFQSQNIGSELSSLNEFLAILQDPLYDFNQNNQFTTNINTTSNNNNITTNNIIESKTNNTAISSTNNETDKAKSKDHFFLTAADPSFEKAPEQRLRLVLEAKQQAGLLKPYDHEKAQDRFVKYLQDNVEKDAANKIMTALEVVRPGLQAITASLQPVERLLIEEKFERLLMGYERVFTSMAVPACLWRRSGQICRANREFAVLVGCSVDELRAGNKYIYELLTIPSIVNLWEKFTTLTFDSAQKSFLMHCNLQSQCVERKVKPCCVTYTLVRDSYNMPLCIVGNFIPATQTH